MNNLEILLENQKLAKANPDNITAEVIAKAYEACSIKDLIDFSPVDDPYTSEPRKLKSTYKEMVEVRKEVKGYINFRDVQSECVAILGLELAMEIDRFVLSQMRKEATPLKSNYRYDVGIGKWSDIVVPRPSFTPDWIITSPEILENTNLTLSDEVQTFTSSFGMAYKGTTPDGVKVYQDPLAPPKIVLFGKKESYTYAPYVWLEPRKTEWNNYEFYCHDKGYFHSKGWLERIIIDINPRVIF